MKRTTIPKTKAETTEQKQVGYRFFKSHLPTIVWNPATDSVLADFTPGHFITYDPKVAKILRKNGYPEIAMDATEPPNIIVNQPTRVLKKGASLPVITPGMSEKLIQERLNAVTEEITPLSLVE